MPKPSLDELYSQSVQDQPKPSLDEIYNQSTQPQAQEQPDSIMKNMIQGQNPIEAVSNYAQKHPFKTAFQGPTETLTGETAQTKLLRNQPYQTLPGRDLPVVGGAVKAAEIGYNTFKDMPASAAGWAADQVSPANIATLGLTKVPGVKEVGQVIAKSPVGKAVGEFLTKEREIPTGVKHLENRVFKLYNDSVGAKIKNPGTDINKFKGDRIEAMKTISDNLPDIKLTDINTGESVSRIPNNRYELLQSLNQAKKAVWNKVSDLSGGATEAGAKIDIAPIVDKALKSTISNIGEDAIRANPGLVNEIVKAADNVKKIGITTPSRAEAYMKYLNTEVQRLRQSGQAVDFSVKDLYSSLLPELNSATDSAIEQALSKGTYSAYRKQYGALKSAEKEVLGSANKYLRTEGGRGMSHPIVNLWSVEELLHGGARMAMGDVAGGAQAVARGGLIKGASKIVDHFTSPDSKITKMFELLGKRAPKSGTQSTVSNGGSVIPEVLGGPAGLPKPSVANPYAKGLPSPRQAGSGGGPEIQQPFQRNPGLPAPPKQSLRSDRALPSPQKAGNATINQGTDIPASTSKPKYGTDAANELYQQELYKQKVPLHPPREGKEMMGELYSPKAKENIARSAGIKPEEVSKLQDISDYFDQIEPGGRGFKSGGKQTGSEAKYWSKKSDFPKYVQSIGPKRTKEIIQNGLNGGKVTDFQKRLFKRLLKDFGDMS